MTRDLCCPSCKGPLSMCTNKDCWHHLERAAAELKDDRSLRLYHDPTARQAINNVNRRPRRRGRRR